MWNFSFIHHSMNNNVTSSNLPENSTHEKKDFSIKCLLDLPENVTKDSCTSKKNSKRNGKSHKRVRTIFTNEQLQKLEACFQVQQYMVRNERVVLAQSLGLAEPQVKIWFQNRRIKWRKVQHETNLHKLRGMIGQSSEIGIV